MTHLPYDVAVDWIEWTAKPGWLDVLGLLLTIGGLAWAILQARDARILAGHAKEAADHAKEAAEHGKEAAEHAQRAAKLAEEQAEEAKRSSDEAANESREATRALQHAQRQLSMRAALVLAPHFQTVANDLAYAMPNQDVQVATRALIRFSHLARETHGVLEGLDGDHGEFQERLFRASERATRVKGNLSSKPDPDVQVLTKSVAAEVDGLSTEMTGLSSLIQHTIEGVESV